MNLLIPLAVAALVSAAISTIGPNTPAVAATTPPLLRVMPLGDSITMGTLSESKGGYRLPLWNLVAGQSRYTVDYVGSQQDGTFADTDHEGHGGWTINDISGGVDSWLKLQRPDVVLLHIGINDIRTGSDPIQAAGRLGSLVDQIFTDRPGVAVILQGLIPTTGGLQAQVKQFNDRARLLEPAERQLGRHLSFLDAPALTPDQFGDSPPLHPDDAGYALMAKVFFAGLEQAVTDGWAPGNSPSPGSAPEISSRVRWADFDGDGRLDYIVVNDDGSVRVYLNKGGDSGGGWQDLGQVATGLDRDRSKIRFADLNGDGRADYLLIARDGSVQAWLNMGGDGHGGWQPLGQVAAGLTNDSDRVRFADFTGDGKADYLLINDDGSVKVLQNNGGDSPGGGGWQDLGQVATGLTTKRDRVRWADFDGDGRADYAVINDNGSVQVYLNRGGDTGGGWQGLGQVAAGVAANADRVRLADFDGDHRADYLLVNAGGSVDAYLNRGGDGPGFGGWQNLGQVATGVVTE